MMNLKKEQIKFGADVLAGLAKSNKTLASKYLYDERGSFIFNQITRHPDYYLTNCEIEILTRYAGDIAKRLQHTPFNLIELGPGEGIKTSILINYLMQQKIAFTYMPIDISSKYLEFYAQELLKAQPKLTVKPILGDYAKNLTCLQQANQKRNLILFLGSSIGNFDLPSARQFLADLYEMLNHDDYVLIGFDLKKPMPYLFKAYDDETGLTRAFNLNLLARINRELGGHFLLDQFYHYATYNVHRGAMESYLISLISQSVAIDALDRTFSFEAFEPVHIEYSYKYLLTQIEALANATGFKLITQFQDSKKYFVDSLWQVKK